MGCGSSTANVAELEAQVKKAESAKKMAEDELNQLKASTKKEIEKLKGAGGGGTAAVGSSKEVLELEGKLRAAEAEITKLKGSSVGSAPTAAPAQTAPPTAPAATAPAATSATAATNGPTGTAPKIVLLGPPACGKGKQADLILSKYNLVHISPGVVLREASQADTPLGNEIKAAIKARTTVPDNLTVQALKNKVLSSEIVKAGFLLDGYPRTAEQAKLLKEHGVPIDKIVLVETSQQALVDKLSSRWLDPDTGLFYDMRVNPPTDEAITQRLIQRADDQESVIRGRLETFFGNISAIEKEIGQAMHRVNGDLSEEEVFAEIDSLLTK